MMRWYSKARQPIMRGFTLVELMVVVAIVMIVAAVAIPNVLNGMRFLRLRSNATNISTLLQQARMRAVRDNRSYQMILGAPASMGGQRVLFVDIDFSGTYTAGDPVVGMAADVQISAAAPAAAPDIFVAQAMAPNGGGGAQPMALQVAPSAIGVPGPTFNPRGVPCRVNGGAISSQFAVCNTIGAGNQPIGYVIYLQSTTIANDGWSAITVSPGGRIRTWILAPATPNRWR